MVKRTFWLQKIEKAWKSRSVLWLSGVRRAGKTTLCHSLPEIEYFDCEKPSARRMMEDPEAFLEQHRGKRIVLDEIHRLSNPSELLKIAADHFPQTKVLATGSSSLGASAKFKDTLTGRKTEVWLTPMASGDLVDFHSPDLPRRFLRGGLPPLFLPEEFPEEFFQGWMDDYWSKDILELFRLEKKYSFQKFVELLLAQSGGIFEASSFTGPCEVSRQTITNYLSVLEETYVAHVIRPFSTHRPTEIVSAPKVYGFDTGFVCYYRGWHDLRRDDLGLLWEHYVLNEIHAELQTRRILYWRDKRGREIDFVLSKPGAEPIAVECKWSAANFQPGNLKAFKALYPKSRCAVVSNDTDKGYPKMFGGMKVEFFGLRGLMGELENIKRG